MSSRKILAAASVLALVLPTSMANADESGGAADALTDLVSTTPAGSGSMPEMELPTSGPVTVMVELADDPVTVVEANSDGTLTTAQEESIQDDIAAEQAPVAQAIEALGGTVESQLQWTYNGLRVSVDASQLEAVRDLDGVTAVHGIPQHDRINIDGLKEIGAPQVWDQGDGTGYTGQGVKVAVVDTGIDYTHLTFGGKGTAEEYAAATAASDPTPYYGSRVKGGVDLAGDAYTGFNTPAPDANPIDCEKQGHGTHVAGTLGGSGVLTSDQTFAGPYTDEGLAGQEFKVGPGMAPEADLYAIKVFGCAGGTDLTAEGIEAAVRDFDVDVINLSLGTPSGTVYDPAAVAAGNAVASGVVVVAAAGNAGPAPYMASSPSTGAGVISVAANDAHVDLADGLGQNPDYRQVADFSSAGPRSGDSHVRPSVTAPGVGVLSATVGSGSEGASGSGTSMASPFVAGAAALVKQAHPTWGNQEISSTLVSTAQSGNVAGYSVPRAGGAINVPAAVGSDVFAYGDTSEVAGQTVVESTLSFGYAEFTGTHTDTRTVTLVNKGDTARTYQVSRVQESHDVSANVSLSADSVTVPAGGTATVDVTISVDSANVPSSMDTDHTSPWFYQDSGVVRFTPVGEDQYPLEVPYLLVPRSLSSVTAQAASTATGADITLSNPDGALAGTGLLFTLGLTDPQDVPADGDTGIDLASVGVATQETAAGTTLVFAVNSHTRHSNPAANRYWVVIDHDQDGSPDAAVFSADSGQMREGVANGKAETFVMDLTTNTWESAGFATVSPTDSSTVLMFVPAAQIHAEEVFDYSAVSLSQGTRAVDEIDGSATYDPSNRAFTDGTAVSVPVGQSATLPLEVNASAPAPKGWMVVVFDNAQGTTEALTGDLPVEPSSPAPTDPTPSGSPSATPSESASPSPGPAVPKPTPVPVKPGLPRTGL